MHNVFEFKWITKNLSSNIDVNIQYNYWRNTSFKIKGITLKNIT